MHGITDKQQKILDFLKSHLRDEGYYPSYQEIMDEFDFKSTNAVTYHIKQLEANGALIVVRKKYRAYKILDNPAELDELKKLNRIFRKYSI